MSGKKLVKVVAGVGTGLLLASTVSSHSISHLARTHVVHAEATSEESWMPDERLRELLAELVGIPVESLIPSDLKYLTIKELDLKDITDLKGIEHVKQVEKVILYKTDNLSNLEKVMKYGIVYVIPDMGTTDFDYLIGLKRHTGGLIPEYQNITQDKMVFKNDEIVINLMDYFKSKSFSSIDPRGFSLKINNEKINDVFDSSTNMVTISDLENKPMINFNGEENILTMEFNEIVSVFVGTPITYIPIRMSIPFVIESKNSPDPGTGGDSGIGNNSGNQNIKDIEPTNIMTDQKTLDIRYLWFYGS